MNVVRGRDCVFGVAPYLVIFAAALHLGYPLLESAPLAHDHPTHLFKAWHMATQLLPSLRLRGFSHFWVFGFPSDELVPPGEELWVLLFRLLTLGKLSWLKTYGLAIFGLLTFSGFAMYRFTRLYFGRIAGVFAGLLMVWDPGDWAQGGWFWAISWGVWPVTLGVSCLLMTLVSLEKLLRSGTARQFLFSGSWVAVTLLSHQAMLVFLPALVGLLLLEQWIRRARCNARLSLALLAFAFGVALASFYLIPMLARSDQTLDLGQPGTTFEDVGKRLVELRVFNGTWPGLLALAFVGAVAGFRRGVAGVFFAAVGTALFIALSTDFLIGELHLERVMPSLRKIEALRMLMAAKALWFALAAYGLSLAFEGPLDFLRSLSRRPTRAFRTLLSRSTLGLVIAGAALLPYVAPALREYSKAFVTKKDIPSEKVAYLDDLRELWAYTATLRSQSSQHYRIAYELPRHDHIATLAPVFDSTFIYKVGNTPTQAFIEFPQYSDPRLFRLLSVKYVVSDHPLDPNLYAEERKFGSLALYRFNDFNPAPFSVIGAGQGELIEFSPERIRVRLRDTNSDSRLKLHVSYLDHWRARHASETLRILPATTFGIEDPFLMEVPARDGEITFEYVRCASDWLGLLLTLSAFPVFFARRYIARAGSWWALRSPLSVGKRRALGAVPFVAGAALLVALAVRYRAQAGLVKKDSLLRGLADGEMTVEGQACQRSGLFHWSCGPREVQAQRVSGASGMHLCYTTSGNSLEIQTRALADFIAGTYDVRGGSGELRAWLDGQDLGSAVARPSELDQEWVQFDVRARRRDGSSMFRLRVAGSPLHCFDFRAMN